MVNKEEEKRMAMEQQIQESAIRGYSYVENLPEFQKAKFLASWIIQSSNYSLNCFYKSMWDQVIRSSTSVLANIAEGHGRGARNQLRQFYTIARGSAYETVAWLQVMPMWSKEILTIARGLTIDIDNALVRICEPFDANQYCPPVNSINLTQFTPAPKPPSPGLQTFQHPQPVYPVQSPQQPPTPQPPQQNPNQSITPQQTPQNTPRGST